MRTTLDLDDELMGALLERNPSEVWVAVGHLPWADLDHDAWREVGEVGSRLRRRGQWVPQTDVVIAVAAVRTEASVWSHDRDFQQIQEALPGLRLYQPEISSPRTARP